MAVRSRPSLTKRQKEMARQQKQEHKRTRRLESKNSKAAAIPPSIGEDPDLSGIHAGPQPPPAWVERDRDS